MLMMVMDDNCYDAAVEGDDDETANDVEQARMLGVLKSSWRNAGDDDNDFLLMVMTVSLSHWCSCC